MTFSVDTATIVVGVGFIIALARQVSSLTAQVSSLTKDVDKLVKALDAERDARETADVRLHQRIDNAYTGAST